MKETLKQQNKGPRNGSDSAGIYIQVFGYEDYTLTMCYACGVAGRKGGSVFNSDSKNKVILMNKGILISFSK